MDLTWAARVFISFLTVLKKQLQTTELNFLKKYWFFNSKAALIIITDRGPVEQHQKLSIYAPLDLLKRTDKASKIVRYLCVSPVFI